MSSAVLFNPSSAGAVVSSSIAETVSERTRPKTALGHDQPLPWPASLDEELALAERNLSDPLRDHVPQVAPTPAPGF